MTWFSSAAQWLLLTMVRGYRLLLKAWLGGACRFEPTCSAYALEALQTHGPWRGGALSAKRLMRCGPWCPGGHDPVPPPLFSTLVGATDAPTCEPNTYTSTQLTP